MRREQASHADMLSRHAMLEAKLGVKMGLLMYVSVLQCVNMFSKECGNFSFMFYKPDLSS